MKGIFRMKKPQKQRKERTLVEQPETNYDRKQDYLVLKNLPRKENQVETNTQKERLGPPMSI